MWRQAPADVVGAGPIGLSAITDARCATRPGHGTRAVHRGRPDRRGSLLALEDAPGSFGIMIFIFESSMRRGLRPVRCAGRGGRRAAGGGGRIMDGSEETRARGSLPGALLRSL